MRYAFSRVTQTLYKFKVAQSDSDIIQSGPKRAFQSEHFKVDEVGHFKLHSERHRTFQSDRNLFFQNQSGPRSDFSKWTNRTFIKKVLQQRIFTDHLISTVPEH